MFERTLRGRIELLLNDFAAVAIIGARQVGKTTLARAIADQRHSAYVDLESPTDRAMFSDPELFFRSHQDELIVLDEVQKLPDVFGALRGQIDRNRRRGKKVGQFLLLGSASRDLLKQTSESLAGRITYLELSPLHLLEVNERHLDQLWYRGGFPESFLARSDSSSQAWRNAFITTYLERDLPQLGPRIPAETLRRFWTMLAHRHASLWNAEELARSLALSGKTIASYLDIFVDLFLVRRLQPWHENVGKRLVKTPRVFVRDSGILHALLGLRSLDELLSHPIAGKSWEGFVVDALMAVAPDSVTAHFYRTSAGAEIDLLLQLPGNQSWAIEIKRGLTPKVEKGFYLACEDIRPTRRFVIYPGTERFALRADVDAVPLATAMRELQGAC
jgi:uncharacterized protein